MTKRQFTPLALLLIAGLTVAGCNVDATPPPQAVLSAQDILNAQATQGALTFWIAATQVAATSWWRDVGLTATAEVKAERVAATATAYPPTVTAQAQAMAATQAVVDDHATKAAFEHAATQGAATAAVTATQGAGSVLATQTQAAALFEADRAAWRETQGRLGQMVVFALGALFLGLMGLVVVFQAPKWSTTLRRGLEQWLEVRARRLVAKRDQQLAVETPDRTALLRPGDSREVLAFLAGVRAAQTGALPPWAVAALGDLAPVPMTSAPVAGPAPAGEDHGEAFDDAPATGDDDYGPAVRDLAHAVDWQRAITALLQVGEAVETFSRDDFCQATGCTKRAWRALVTYGEALGVLRRRGNGAPLEAVVTAQWLEDNPGFWRKVDRGDLPPYPTDPAPDVTYWAESAQGRTGRADRADRATWPAPDAVPMPVEWAQAAHRPATPPIALVGKPYDDRKAGGKA